MALRPSPQGMGWHAHALAGADHRGQKLLACTTRSLLKGRKWGYSLPAQPANQDKKRWVTGSATKAAVANLLLGKEKAFNQGWFCRASVAGRRKHLYAQLS